MSTEAKALLHVRELCVTHTSARGELAILRNVSFDLRAHECLGLVGESGSGKTQLLHALLGLCAASARVRGSARFHGQELIKAPAPLLAAVRGRRLGLVFQDPLSALNPYLRIGLQLCEGARAQLGLSRRAAWQRAATLLDTLQIDEPELRLRQYPQELSGGMRQRVMIAMALMCEPEVLLLDEPTTALDVTVQAQVLTVLRELRSRTGVAMIFVTHDLGVLAAIADRVAVLYAGRIVEFAPIAQLYAAPQHPYTAALLRALPRLDAPLGERLPAIPGQPPPTGPHGGLPLGRNMSEPLLEVRELRVRYPTRGRVSLRTAVDGVSFAIAEGESLGLVGESGSGKSSIARALLRLVPATGAVHFEGRDLLQLRGTALRATRERLQIIFQDPLAALDPRMRVVDIVAEPLREFRRQLSAAERRSQAASMLERVGLDSTYLARFPHECSGGQAQRIGIARALMLGPRLLICDEPVASLDVSITAQIVNLLHDLQRELKLTLLFIAHDLATVRQVCERVIVLYHGQIMESAPRAQLYAAPRHPYTRALLAAVPVPDPTRAQPLVWAGREPGSAPNRAQGCVFRSRCPVAFARCAIETPTLRSAGAGFAACHLPAL